MGQLQTITQELEELGYQILGISPDRPEKLAESAAKNESGIVLLSDSKMAASDAFGLSFRVDDKTIEAYRGYGIDLTDASGETHRLLPVPSVWVVGKDGKVGFSYVNPDYRVRIDPDVVLAAAKSLAE